VNAATGLVTYVWSYAHSDHVVFIGTDGHIWELALKQGSSEIQGQTSKGLPWEITDITSELLSNGQNPGYVPPVMSQG
jgi:hypothetical protein